MVCKRNDFIFSIAFNKETIVINKRLKGKYANKPFSILLEKGLFRQALAAAVFDRNEEQMQAVVKEYGRLIKNTSLTIGDVKKIFGIHDVPSTVKAVQLI